MAQGLTNYDAMLKEDYRPVIISTINNRSNLRKLFKKAAQFEAGGRRVVYPIHYGRNVGVGAVSENNTLPSAGNQSQVEKRVTFKRWYGRIQLSGPVMEDSRKDKFAFAKAVTHEMNGLTKDVSRFENRALFGTGIGILCRVSGSNGANTVINIKDPGGVSGGVGAGRYLQPNDVVAVVRNATPANATDADILIVRTVSSVSDDGSQVTFSATTGQTLNDNDMIVLAPAGASVTTQSSVNKEPEGILAGIDDGSFVNSYQNINRTTIPQYKSGVISLNGDISFDVLQQLEDLVAEKSDEGLQVLLSHQSVRREYLAKMYEMKRFTNEGGKAADAGWAGGATGENNPKWNGHEWIADRMCPYGTIFGINKEFLVWYPVIEGDWADVDGTILMRVDDVDAYEARFRVFGNFTVDRPDACGRIDGVNATVRYVAAE